MKLWIGTANIKPVKDYPVVAIGNFDGLHRGHQAILSETLQRARENNGTAVVLTFEPHPFKVLQPKRNFKLLNSFQIKVRQIESSGIDVCFTAEFNKAFSGQSPYDFAKTYLHDKIGCKEVVVGQNFRFGKDRVGTLDDLIRFGKEFGFEVFPQDPVWVDELVVSSSRIRQLVQDGDVGLAGKMLGHYYEMEGKVLHGDGMGEALGYPTANFRLPNELVPREGVYAARVSLLSSKGIQALEGIVYIGSKPTFEKKSIRMEVHLFNFREDLYGRRLLVTFIAWIREDIKFRDKASLVRQIGEDIEKAKLILKEEGPAPLSA
ncbi:MAG: bifunctional riboflavin kinase/FAD synthetase [Nitrospiria bacterium]